MMSLPRFTADEALARSSNTYGARWSGSRRSGAFPALQKQGGENLLTCRMDCYDKCMDLGHVSSAKCNNQCTKRCRDLGIGGTSGSNATNCDLSKAGCYAWYAACSLDPFGFGCNAVLDQCLKDSNC
jgi:hypothetical protein